ncbi:hypothetical protein ACH4CE_36060 [Streptomyces gelaticus]|uniref:hypothetical protein n=1 Tax=Streptomyces gelaticus TaxID=285446 RepID=UPI0037A5A45C
MKFLEDHPVYGWKCCVVGCQGPAVGGGQKDMCCAHLAEFRRRVKTEPNLTRYHFQQTAPARNPMGNVDPPDCRICLERPSYMSTIDLCSRHYRRWLRARDSVGEAADFELWCSREKPLRSFGDCLVSVCHLRAATPLGLCETHEKRYRTAGRPGLARVAIPRWMPLFDLHGGTVPIAYDDDAFRAWCSTEIVRYRAGQVSLRGLPPLVRAEIQWGLFARSQRRDHAFWSLQWVQTLVNQCRRRGWMTLFDIGKDDCSHTSRMIVRECRSSWDSGYAAGQGTLSAAASMARWAEYSTNPWPGSEAWFEMIRVPRIGPARRVRPEHARADKAYASRKNCAYLRRRGTQCTIPDKADPAHNRQKLGSRDGRRRISPRLTTANAKRSRADQPPQEAQPS